MLLGISLVACAPNPRSSPHYGDLRDVDVVAVHDGDTFHIDRPEWPAIIGRRMPVRVAGVDTPELKGDCEAEIQRAQAARKFTETTLRKAARVDLLEIRRGRYFRLLAEVRVDGENLAKLLIAAGHGRLYRGGQRSGWCAAQPGIDPITE